MAGLSATASFPWRQCCPPAVKEVQDVLKAAYETGTKVIARGSGTGLSGGATPEADAS